MYYGKVFKSLNQANVKFVVAGGVAVVMHGYERYTKDLDLLVLLESKNLAKLFNTLLAIGYKPKAPVTCEQFIDKNIRAQWKKQKGALVFSFVQSKPPFKAIDILIDERIPFNKVYKESIQVKIKGLKIPLLSIDYLIKLKAKASRPQDLIDVVQLREIKARIKDEAKE